MVNMSSLKKGMSNVADFMLDIRVSVKSETRVCVGPKMGSVTNTGQIQLGSGVVKFCRG